jgi:hypothetical protein
MVLLPEGLDCGGSSVEVAVLPFPSVTALGLIKSWSRVADIKIGDDLKVELFDCSSWIEAAEDKKFVGLLLFGVDVFAAGFTFALVEVWLSLPSISVSKTVISNCSSSIMKFLTPLMLDVLLVIADVALLKDATGLLLLTVWAHSGSGSLLLLLWALRSSSELLLSEDVSRTGLLLGFFKKVGHVCLNFILSWALLFSKRL